MAGRSHMAKHVVTGYYTTRHNTEPLDGITIAGVSYSLNELQGLATPGKGAVAPPAFHFMDVEARAEKIWASRAHRGSSEWPQDVHSGDAFKYRMEAFNALVDERGVVARGGVTETGATPAATYPPPPVSAPRDTRPRAPAAHVELPPGPWMTDALGSVIMERRRQQTKEHFDAHHDDVNNPHGELARAAAVYAMVGSGTIGSASIRPNDNGYATFRDLWPWQYTGFKPRDRRTNLVKAAALLLAEIERLDRAEKKARGDGT